MMYYLLLRLLLVERLVERLALLELPELRLVLLLRLLEVVVALLLVLLLEFELELTLDVAAGFDALLPEVADVLALPVFADALRVAAVLADDAS